MSAISSSTRSRAVVAPAASRLGAVAVILGCGAFGLGMRTAQAQQPAAAALDTAVSYSRRGADTCLSCHESATVALVFQTRHGDPGNARSPFGHGQLQCEACHGPGGAHAARLRRGHVRPAVIRFGTGSEAPVEVQNEQCLACHATTLAGWHGGSHDPATIACADCHSVHTARDRVLVTETQPEVCYGCHTLERAEALRPFAHPLHEGKMDCSACHHPHGSSAQFELARETVNETCFQCHADKRGPFLWEHAPVAEDCTLCHAPHGSNQPGMLVLRGPMLCQTCHAELGHPSVAQDADGLPGAQPTRYLLGENCLNCHPQVHGSNHPSGARLMR